MSATTNEGVPQQDPADEAPQGQVSDELAVEESGKVEKNEENPMPSAEEEEEAIKKKYGGVLPKKKPLISKDHERAFFDSADWALGKVSLPSIIDFGVRFRPRLF